MTHRSRPFPSLPPSLGASAVAIGRKAHPSGSTRVRFTTGDTQGAIADIRATLQHEPRSFAAFSTLAGISEARKDWRGAYDAWQKVLEIDPKTPGGQERLKDLRRHALGEEA